MKKGLIIMNKDFVDLVYPEKVREEIESLADIYEEPLSREQVKENPEIVKDAEIIFSGWDGPRMDKAFLDAAPNLKALFYAAGTVKPLLTDAVWERNLTITAAGKANAVPVVEYTLSQILFSLKDGWNFVNNIKKEKHYPKKPYYHVSGAFGSTVGIISLSTIGKKVAEILKQFDVNVLAYDPFADKSVAEELNVELCSIEDIFATADVVSLHAPLLSETRGLIRGSHFRSMKKNASFINTARGEIVMEAEMVEVLQERDDITAILDVTFPEPPEESSLLYTLPNIILTPHIAGSEGKECGRLGSYMLEEFKRYIEGKNLKWQVMKEQYATMPEN
ncbi:hydroxyacid dehydrogenase [Virgibacillus halodenitrificans]|uniref:hydroxyacid dehydrogenase n=1 Tax=Virgibacillus halodenitrificans TaxID=1482 RepID=UPI0024C04FF1|nr:hydroxyacid dehydrogenase [Virgibacillus halodenitrificans]WHX26547.1 hydroxyacid dehydrogenase [Virgibacillus halodenitrificans]